MVSVRREKSRTNLCKPEDPLRKTGLAARPADGMHDCTPDCSKRAKWGGFLFDRRTGYLRGAPAACWWGRITLQNPGRSVDETPLYVLFITKRVWRWRALRGNLNSRRSREDETGLIAIHSLGPNLRQDRRVGGFSRSGTILIWRLKPDFLDKGYYFYRSTIPAMAEDEAPPKRTPPADETSKSAGPPTVTEAAPTTTIEADTVGALLGSQKFYNPSE